jgi:predicted phage gp36 major capsid-like protein
MPALLNLRYETAAQLLAEDRKTDEQIAVIVGISRRTIQYWKHRPEIKSRIEEICELAATRLNARIERHEWLWERDCLRREAKTSKSQIARRVAIAQLSEMSAL